MAVTIKSLAAHLGLTTGTVSRALNDYSDISVTTRARVKAAADELGYRPNQNARRLSIGTPETICYLMPRHNSDSFQPFVSQLLGGLSDALNERNWDLVISQSETSQSDLDKLEQLIQSGRIAGVVLSRPLKNDPRITLLQKLECPFVVHGRTSSSEDYAWYDVDGHDAFVTAVNHLVQLGHRNIGFVGAPTHYEFVQQRLDGYRCALRHNGLEEFPDHVQLAEFTDRGGEIATTMLLDLPTPPTAIVCVSDVMAFGALTAIRSKDLIPGKDVSVIGYDGVRFGVHSSPPLTTLAQPQAQAGHRLGDMLFALIDGAEPKSQQELQRAQLVRRKTDGPPLSVRASEIVSHREELQ